MTWTRLSFIAYSSGTTGKPKGIANPHRAPVLSYDLRFRLSDLGPGDRVACNVFFVWEILRPLLRGATVVCVADEISYDPIALAQFLSMRNITETLMTPTLLAAVLASSSIVTENLSRLKTLWLNGEVVTTDLARRALKALSKTRLLNCYSACETHEIACGDIAAVFDEQQSYCAVGPPMDPTHIYILDEHGNRLPDGEIGELYVGGSMLARCYINQPDTTAKAFVANPLNPGTKMYRTGDVARILPSGSLEITGRVGAMIKLRGYSVVPGKVENVIVEHLAVRQCAVVALGDGLERQLVAYVVRDHNGAADRAPFVIDSSGYSPSARKALSGSLAQYMLPTLWVEVDTLPTNAVSGKVALKQLPLPPHGGVPDTGSSTPVHTSSRNSPSVDDVCIDVPVARLADPPTLAGHVGTVRSILAGEASLSHGKLIAQLEQDCVLDNDIACSNTTFCRVSEAKAVLLTGATGFLGPFLLRELLQSTDTRIICLVRFGEPHRDDVPAGVARLRRTMLDFGIWSDSIMDRIEVLPGDISRERLGLSATLSMLWRVVCRSYFMPLPP
ncbi:hypothetical protein MRB53_040326 [Persea americana]|nr:hypothetical protein MRB53_040326 [Persea americana]